MMFQDGLFDGLVNLQQIRLDNNSIQAIGSRLFSNPSDLPSLNSVDVSHNKLAKLDPWPIFRAQAFPAGVVTVDVCENTIQTLTSSPNWTYSQCSEEELNYKLQMCASNVTSFDNVLNGYFTGSGYIPCHVRKFTGHVKRRQLVNTGVICQRCPVRQGLVCIRRPAKSCARRPARR